MIGPELKPCPFCGHELEIRTKRATVSAHHPGTSSCALDGLDWYPSLRFVDQWNTRTAPDPAALVRAALEAAARELDGCNLGLDPADMAADIRAIAADPAAVAEIVAKAKEQGE
jgi:hypothetical protein